MVGRQMIWSAGARHLMKFDRQYLNRAMGGKGFHVAGGHDSEKASGRLSGNKRRRRPLRSTSSAKITFVNPWESWSD
jgi:hypothetical protein